MLLRYEIKEKTIDCGNGNSITAWSIFRDRSHPDEFDYQMDNLRVWAGTYFTRAEAQEALAYLLDLDGETHEH